jgi:hypothetical protein
VGGPEQASSPGKAQPEPAGLNVVETASLPVMVPLAQPASLLASLGRLRVGDVEALHAGELSEWVDGPVGEALAAHLESAAEWDTPAFAARTPQGAAALVLQNDLWGLWQRADGVDGSVNAARVRDGCASLVRRLASPRPIVARQAAGVPPALSSVLADFTPLESEMVVLQHELAFGGRRVFHVAASGATRGATRALYSTIVGIDSDGSLYPTEIVGDLEMLEFDGDTLLDARVFELRREWLDVRQPAVSMQEVFVVEAVPGLGRNTTVAIVWPPQPVSDLPCAGCHHNAGMMSLPSDELVLGGRIAGVLAFAARSAPQWHIELR